MYVAAESLVDSPFEALLDAVERLELEDIVRHSIGAVLVSAAHRERYLGRD
jgi:hypothetical protein